MRRILCCFLLMMLPVCTNWPALAIVNPDAGITLPCQDLSQEVCKNQSQCWWTPLVKSEMYASCLSCSNTPQTGSSFVSGSLNLYEDSITSSNFLKLYSELDTSNKIFCPWIFECEAGKIPSYNSITGKYSCVTCADNTFSSTSRKIIVTGVNEYWDTSPSGFVLSNPNTQLLCRSCGINAHPNSDHTNCDCDTGYQTSDGKKTNVDMSSCSDIAVYEVRLFVPGTTFIMAKPINYKYGVGYDINRDGNYANDRGNEIYAGITRDKYEIFGWSPNENATPSATGFSGILGNILPLTGDPFNIADYCAENTCDYVAPDNNIIKMYAIWQGKTYKVVYQDNNYRTVGLTARYGETLTVKRTQDLNLERCEYYNMTNPDSYGERVNCAFAGYFVPDGKLFAGWMCDNCKNSGTLLRAGYPIEEPDGEYPGATLTLTAQYSDCESGHYCSESTDKKCPAGSTSNEGASKKSDCFLVGGATRFCDANKTDNCITLPELLGNTIYNVSKD